MDKILVRGGNRLKGEIVISGAKNAALPAMAASLLTSDKVTISNVPQLGDVKTASKLLGEIGVIVESREASVLEIDSSDLNRNEVPYELVKTMRASCLLLAPLLVRCGEVRLSLPGGCAIGERPINLHIKGLEAMGAKIRLEHGYIVASANRLIGNRVYFDTSSVTGTENIMMAAVLAEGETAIENAAKEPEIGCLANMLRSMGAKIEGDGTDTIKIQGVSSLSGCRHTIIPDRIETGTFMVAAAITGGELLLKDTVPQHSEALIVKLRELGVEVEEKGSSILVRGNGEHRSVDISTSPYPGFPTDMQAQFMALLTTAQGSAVVTENVFENRFMHVAEMKRMGADIKVKGKSAFVKGVKELSGAPLMATDLRASASLILAALAANGESTISRVYHLDRGYEKIEEKLLRVGANIERLK
ncbi:MAG: UDP-N-acetylglucosamine 1-carboxyvinyltransferase [Nitrospinota bacterium]